jgi:hypothetical protein
MPSWSSWNLKDQLALRLQVLAPPCSTPPIFEFESV